MSDKTKKKPMGKLLKAVIFIAVLAVVLATVIIIDRLGNRSSAELDIKEAQLLVDDTFNSLPNAVAKSAKLLAENTDITVNTVDYGTEKDIILGCTYSTLDIAGAVKECKDELFERAYSYYDTNRSLGKKTNAMKVMLEVETIINSYLQNAESLTGEIDICVYQMNDGSLMLHLSNETVNTVFGGILDAKKAINEVTEIEYNGETVSITNLNTIRTGISDCFSLKNYDNTKPNTGTPLTKWWAETKDEFRRNFIVNNQWKYLANGLLTTIEITFLALIIGIVIGFLVAIVRVTYSKTGKMKLLSSICQVYISIIRGTPVMVQLLIIYFVLLLPIGIEKFPAAVLCFGLNSGAYVSEIVRGGIMSVDNGQTEAGRSLGFNYAQTMLYVVIPQAFKAVLPALANEFITLLKESSVAFYIGVADLTQGGLKIRSITYSNFMPLIAVALIYLVVVLGLTKLVSLLEKRLQKGDR